MNGAQFTIRIVGPGCWFRLSQALAGLTLAANSAAAENAVAASSALAPVDMGGAVLRMLGAFVFVVAIFLAGVWLYRNFARFGRVGAAPKLAILETRPLGNRHVLFVVAYEQQRLMLSTSPSGVTLITHLPEAVEPLGPAEPGASGASGASGTAVPRPRFPVALQEFLAGRS